MWLPNWLRSSKRIASPSRRSTRRAQAPTTRLYLEPLEDRTLLSAGWAISNGGTGTLGGFQEISAPDAAGNMYVTGYFNGTATFGSTTLNASTESSYVAKVDANGHFLWATQIGGSAGEDIPAIAVDSSGNVCATGNFSGTASFGSTTLTSAGGTDVYICKLDTNGNVLWARQAGGSSGDDPTAMAVDSSGNVYVTGMFDHGGTATVSATFGPTTLTATCSNVQGQAPIFLSKLDTNGNFLWSEQVLGSTSGQPWGIAGDSSGNMYVVGDGGQQGLSDVGFMEKVDPNGNVVWEQGTSHPVFADAVFQDPSSGATWLYTSIWPTSSAPVSVEKLDASSGSVLWSKAVGTSDYSEGRAMAVDANGNVYVAGQFSGTGDFDPGSGTANLTSAPNSYDAFLYKLDPSGNFLSARSMAGSGFNMGSGLALDSSGNIYTAGSYQGTGTFDTGSQLMTLTSPGNTSLFLVKTTQDTGMILGQVFNDLNNNGIFDAGSFESGLPNVTVYLDLNNSGSYVAGDPTAVTDSQGYFHFSDVTPGNYTVRQIVPINNYTATPAFFTVSVTAGQASDMSVFADFTPNKTQTYSNTTAVKTSKGKPNALSSLTVSDSYTVLDTTLTLNLSNTTRSNLSIYLTGPNGTKVSLGSTNQNGTLTYQVPDFDYTLVKGTWKLEIDGLGQGGVLKSWSLRIDGTLS